MSDLQAIEAGLEKGEFFLEYLPTISLEDNRCVGGEALIRWRQGSRIIPPQEFIPLIENTPLAERLTRWVLDTVARELGEWLRSHDLVQIGINVPPEVFARNGIERVVYGSSLRDIGHKLIFEVTARTVADRLDVDTLDNKENPLVLVALDDVGADHTDIAMLAQARVDIVKIDKAFVDRMRGPDWTQDQLRNLENLINGSSLATIAEGVESPAQVKILREAGVKMAQGWHFSRPLSAEAFKVYFDTHQ